LKVLLEARFQVWFAIENGLECRVFDTIPGRNGSAPLAIVVFEC